MDVLIVKNVLRASVMAFVAWCHTAQGTDFSACTSAGNDLVALQSAINSASDNVVTLKCAARIGAGDPLKIPSGKKLTATSGNGLVQVASNSSKILVLVSGCTSCEVSGLTIDLGGFPSKAVQVQDSSDSRINANVMKNGNGGTAYIFAIRNQGNEYRGNVIAGSKGAQRGMWIGNGGTITTPDIEKGAVIEGNSVTGTDATGIVYTGINGLVRNNFVSDTKGAGLALSSVSTYGVGSTILVRDNVFLRNAFHGIQADAWNGGKTTNVTLLHNICSDNTHAGIYAAHVERWIVQDNDCQNNPDGGIVLYDADTVLISDNRASVVMQWDPTTGYPTNVRAYRNQ